MNTEEMFAISHVCCFVLPWVLGNKYVEEGLLEWFLERTVIYLFLNVFLAGAQHLSSESLYYAVVGTVLLVSWLKMTRRLRKFC
jgi:hypothetical protein